MPLVYVHGVATRRGPDPERYESAVRRRDGLFRCFALPGVLPDPSRPILSPYWGDSGADPAWTYASIPGGPQEAFGIEIDAQDPLAAEVVYDSLGELSADSRTPLVDIARRDGLPAAVDMIVAVGVDVAATDDEGDVDGTTALAAAALDVARQNPSPAWLAQVEDDADLLVNLQEEVRRRGEPEEQESFGWGERWARFREGVDRINDVVPRLLTRGALSVSRMSLQRRVTTFLGDVFVYLRGGERGLRIAKTVGDALRAAADERTNENPLVVIAHSMGGDICYDLLSTDLRDLEVDVFLTVGSQVGFFEELKLFRSSDENIRAGAPVDRAKPPTNLRRWLNVFDRNDPLAFAVEPIFAAPAKDYAYDTGEHTFAAHGAYWVRPSFHERLNQRLKETLAA
jgi:hypothetical protein